MPAHVILTVLSALWSGLLENAAPLEILWTIQSAYILARGIRWLHRKRFVQQHLDSADPARSELQLAARAEAARLLVAIGWLVTGTGAFNALGGILAMTTPPNPEAPYALQFGGVAACLLVAEWVMLAFMRFIEKRQTRLVGLSRQLLLLEQHIADAHAKEQDNG